MITPLAALTYPRINPAAFEFEARMGTGLLIIALFVLASALVHYLQFRKSPAKVKHLFGSGIDARSLDRLRTAILIGALAFPLASAVYAGLLKDGDPSYFTVSVKWYGLAYMVGLIAAWLYIKRLLTTPELWPGKRAPLTAGMTDDLLLWMTLAVVLGGRLGQILLYDLGYYAAHPIEMFKVWRGGMSFHGGVIGSAVAIFMFARQAGVSHRSVADLVCAAAPFGLFLGRIANFINSEHWGRETDAALGMVFPNGGPLPRHPSQLYEAALEGLVMFVVLRFVTHRLLALKNPGFTTGVFLAWYAIARMICEIFREPEPGHILNIGPFTAGQWYSVPMLLIGLWFIMTSGRTTKLERAQA